MLTECVCGTNVEAKLDVEKNAVFCLNCYKEIALSDFTKTMMRQRGDILERKRVTIPPNGLQYTCDNQKCNKPFSAEIDKNDGKVHCPYCGIICNISNITLARLTEDGIFKGYSESYFNDEGEAREVSQKELEEVLEKEVISADFVAPAVKRGRGRPRKIQTN